MMSKAKQITASIELLHKQHTDLLQLSEAKRQALVHNQLDELQRIMQQEANIVKQVTKTEQDWVEAAKAFFLEQDLQPEPDITITQLFERITDQDEKNALIQARARLIETIEALQQANQLNKQLIEQSLQFVNYSLNLMTDTHEEFVYRHPADAQVKPNHRGSMFDTLG